MPEDISLPVPIDCFRFVVAWHSGNKKHQLGVLRSAGHLLETKRTTYDDEQKLRDLIRWFNRNLAAPKGLDMVAAIFWFKPQVADRTEVWERLMELVRLLRKYRYQVEIVTTPRPGKVYSDDDQIAAVPFKDTFEIGSVSVIDRAT